MILLDDRVGARELRPHFSPFGVPVEMTRLDYADMAFVGSAEDGDVMVGVERKRISDLVASMRSKRLSGHQLQGLLDSYRAVYLIVEGVYKPGPTGIVETWRGGEWHQMRFGQPITYAEVDHYLTTLEQLCGLRVRRTGTPPETVQQVLSLYHWWQKPWKRHRSHQEIYAPLPTCAPHRAVFTSPEERIRQKYGEGRVVVLHIAAQLPGLDLKAEAVAEHFASTQAMVEAGVAEWRAIPGIGVKLARQSMEVLRGTQTRL